MYIHSNPIREDEPHALPDVEVFYQGANEASYDGPGWYWWPCHPGCLPDGDPVGPFATEADAVTDVRQDYVQAVMWADLSDGKYAGKEPIA